MAFTKTWNEAAPAGSDNISNGDNEIRDFKTAIRERLAIDHVFDADETGVTNIGTHKQVAMLEAAADPANVTDTGIVYTKDASTITELFYRDSAGTVTQITVNGVLNAPVNTISDIILRGFELVATSTTTVTVNPGSLLHGTTYVNKTTTTALDITSGASYCLGTAAERGTNKWLYVYCDSSGTLGLEATVPDCADSSGNTTGTKLYWNDTIHTKYWRCIGAIRLNAVGSGEIVKFFQQGNLIMLDVPIDSGATYSVGADQTVDCSTKIPSISACGIFLWDIGVNDWTSSISTYIRPYGSTGLVPTQTLGLAGGRYPGGQVMSMTDSAQKIIHYEVTTGTGTSFSIYVQGYYINIR
jgi:hypothetical protein